MFLIGRITCHDGFDRIDAGLWGASSWWATVERGGRELELACWQTMTECVRNGIMIDWDEFVVYPKGEVMKEKP